MRISVDNAVSVMSGPEMPPLAFYSLQLVLKQNGPKFRAHMLSN
jgi:hypothetical protein